MRFHLLLCILGLGLLACPAEPSDDDDATEIVPPGDDDDDTPLPQCDEDSDCRATAGLEICETDTFQCVQGDRNNSIAEAQVLAWDQADRQHIAPAGDIDFFRINATVGDLPRIRATAEDGGALDTVIRYYDREGTEIAFNDDFERVGGVAPNSILHTGVPATGAVYFSVEDRRSFIGDPADPPEGGEDSAYDVDIARAGFGLGASMQSVLEPNESPGDALVWDLAEYRTNYNLGGNLEFAGDSDFLAIDVAPGEVLRLYGFPFGGTAGLTRVTVWMPDGVTPIRTFDGLAWDTDHRLWIPALEDGPYYVEVQDAFGGGGPGHWYWLHGAKNEPIEPFAAEAEPNGEGEPEATGLDPSSGQTESTELWARIGEPGDEDWFSVDAEGGERLTLSLARTEAGAEDTQLSVSLLDPAGDTALGPLTWDGGEDAVFALEELGEAGTWSVVVREAREGQGSGGHYYIATISMLRL